MDQTFIWLPIHHWAQLGNIQALVKYAKEQGTISQLDNLHIFWRACDSNG